MAQMKMETVSCAAGTFSGFEENGCTHFIGIRYAGAERYCAPTPYVYPSGVHACAKPAPFAVQLRSKVESFLSGTAYESFAQEESCQYLSMTLPNGTAPDSRLPVMVWIHGGAYRNGGCDSPSYDRVPLVKENNVIVVGVNYRLGVLGFVKNRDGSFSNNGLLDVIEALKWIRQNIAAFGGDPENVTLFGQSAGADCVRCVMLAEGTENLFHRAILQSDPIGAMEHREAMEQKILDELNALELDASTQALLQAQQSIVSNVTEKGNAKHLIFAPHFGVAPLPAQDEIPQRIKEVAPLHELLIGTATREVAAYIGSIPAVVRLHKFPPTRAILEAVIKKKSMEIFTAPSMAFAKAYAQAGGKAFRYVFCWGEKRSLIGACHAMDIVPLFGCKGQIGKPVTMGLSEQDVMAQGKPMRKIWADFAKTGRITANKVDGMIEIHPVNEKAIDQ